MMIYCQVQWELAPVEDVHEIIEAEETFVVIARGWQGDHVMIVEVQHRTMIFEQAQKILQELVWRVNGGNWCHICFLPQEEVDMIL